MASSSEGDASEDGQQRGTSREWIKGPVVRLLLALGILFNLTLIAYTIGPLVESLMKP